MLRKANLYFLIAAVLESELQYKTAEYREVLKDINNI
jgi:hypothetical protein